MTAPAVQTAHHQERGFTLLEALVTLVIISIGLLGILGLQTVSIANTQISSARTEATLAADNMADRMRANFRGARAGEYDGIDHPSDNAPPAACTTGSPCDFAAMAERDAWEWDERIGTALPKGEGHVDCEETVGGECMSYLVTVLWSERDAEGAAGPADPDIDQCDKTAPDADLLVSGCFQTQVRP